MLIFFHSEQSDGALDILFFIFLYLFYIERLHCIGLHKKLFKSSFGKTFFLVCLLVDHSMRHSMRLSKQVFFTTHTTGTLNRE